MLITFLKDYFSKKSIKYVDIGANSGQFCDAILNNLNVTQAILYEPIPELYEKLRQKYNNDKRILVRNYAVSNYNGSTTFNYNNYSLTSSILRNSKISLKFIDQKYLELNKEINVNTTSLDSEIFDNKVDLLKIDTQGYEYPILRGAKKVLENGFISVIIVELIFVDIYENQSKFEDIHSILTGYNYKLSDIYNKKKENNIIHWCDAVYIKEENLSQ